MRSVISHHWKARQSIERERREATIASLLLDVKQLAERSGSASGRRVAAFLATESRVALPILGEGLQYPARPSRRHIFIAPVLKTDSLLPSSDKHINDFSQPARTDGPSGVYVYATRTIYVALEWPISRLWLELTLLHEGQHALDDVTGQTDHLPIWRREQRSQGLEYSVVMGIYGAQLRSIFDDLAPLLDQAADLGDAANFIWPGDIEQRLELVFGKPINAYDRNEQRAIARTAITYDYLQARRASSTLWRAAVSSPALPFRQPAGPTHSDSGAPRRVTRKLRLVT